VYTLQLTASGDSADQWSHQWTQVTTPAPLLNVDAAARLAGQRYEVVQVPLPESKATPAIEGILVLPAPRPNGELPPLIVFPHGRSFYDLFRL
jgi:dipeptidyl aminopeptidase/acylaminoacyl peptidase